VAHAVQRVTHPPVFAVASSYASRAPCLKRTRPYTGFGGYSERCCPRRAQRDMRFRASVLEISVGEPTQASFQPCKIIGCHLAHYWGSRRDGSAVEDGPKVSTPCGKVDTNLRRETTTVTSPCSIVTASSPVTRSSRLGLS